MEEKKEATFDLFPEPLELLNLAYVEQCNTIMVLQNKPQFNQWSQCVLDMADQEMNQGKYQSSTNLLMLLRKTSVEEIKNICDIKLGKLAYEEKKYIAAFTAFDSVRQRTYKDLNLVPSDIYFWLAKIQAELGQYFEAKEYIRMAAHRGHNLVELLTLSMQIAQLEHSPGKERLFAAIMEMVSQNSDVTFNLNTYKEELKKFCLSNADQELLDLDESPELALRNIKKMITVNRPSAVLYGLGGVAYYELGLYKNAWLFWCKGIEYEPYIPAMERAAINLGSHYICSYIEELLS